MTERRPDPPRSARVALLLGIFTGLSGVAVLPFAASDQFMLASDVYRHAADAMLAGENFYAVSPPRLPGYEFIYPPVVILLFVPHAVLGTAGGSYAIQTVLNVVFAAGTTVVIARALGRRGVAVSRLDLALIAGFALLSAHSAITVINGQVTIWLGFAFALGFHALDGNREALAGVAFAAAALLKVFPAAIGLWLLRCRASRAVVAATLTGLGGLALGAVVLGPDTTATYIQDVLLERYEGQTFDGRPAPDQTVGGVQRQFAALTGFGSPAIAVLGLLVVSPLVATLYRRVGSDLRRQTAVLGTIIGVLLAVPLQRLYMPLLIFPLVVLLYTLPRGRPRTVLLGGTLLSFARLEYALAISIIETLPLPSVVESVSVTATEALYTFVLPTTLGMWLVLVACLLVHIDPAA